MEATNKIEEIAIATYEKAELAYNELKKARENSKYMDEKKALEIAEENARQVLMCAYELCYQMQKSHK